ncbi:MAG TPA: Hsp70 family protein [Burkholderiaceae bacterium]|nr:Hsp70 family protein [Burkholderiaceae bacterium]
MKSLKGAPGSSLCCAIDFGTSNSAVARAVSDADDARPTRIDLAPLEQGATSMPTAVFYSAEDGSRRFGRAAIASYVDGYEGRLMRSIKSILGSDLMDEATELADGLQIKYIDVVIAYLRHIKQQAEAHWNEPIDRAVIGRPVFFVDDDSRRDAKAQQTLLTAARASGLSNVEFQFEPIAAALDYESRLQASDGERLVLVADIGGGTSDFSVVRASKAAHGRIDRRADILANHGVHRAGTDFDKAVNMAKIMPVLGLNGSGPGDRPVPSKIYFDLSTWHLINTTYTPNRVLELRMMRNMYENQRAHERLMSVLTKHRGHDLAARAEAAKIEVSESGAAIIDLGFVESDLKLPFVEREQQQALQEDVARIVATANETVRMAQLKANQKIDAIYFTGGSTGLDFLAAQLTAEFSGAEPVRGDRHASVVSGLAITAQRRFGSAVPRQAK